MRSTPSDEDEVVGHDVLVEVGAGLANIQELVELRVVLPVLPPLLP